MGRGQMQKYVEVSGIGMHDVKSKKESMKVKKKKEPESICPFLPYWHVPYCEISHKYLC